MTVDELNALMWGEFPEHGPHHRVTTVSADALALAVDSAFLRRGPGGTVSGPDQLQLADLAGYALLKYRMGPASSIRLRSASLSYLDAPAPGVLTARAHLLKHAKRNAEVRVDLLDPGARLASTATLLFSVR
ncbi:PaaI family thioesterase [Streptomyces sp. NPDC058486]|uniref:PaaI family thioesterase n=1 Tax=unclassified Streptomyces TaxID=2593676 RepID=UPI00364A27E2